MHKLIRFSTSSYTSLRGAAIKNPYSSNADPWRKILDLLFQCCERGNEASVPVPTTTLIKARASVAHARQSRKPAYLDTQDFWACVTINVLELTESYATIGWHDPTRCRYEDQRWRRFRTLRAGVCAMTGPRSRPAPPSFIRSPPAADQLTPTQ
jgi:hypothetical protein